VIGKLRRMGGVLRGADSQQLPRCHDVKSSGNRRNLLEFWNFGINGAKCLIYKGKPCSSFENGIGTNWNSGTKGWEPCLALQGMLNRYSNFLELRWNCVGIWNSFLESPFSLPCVAQLACPRARTQNWHQPQGGGFFGRKKTPPKRGVWYGFSSQPKWCR